MPKPITFSTEAERVKARKQYLAIDKVAWPSEQGRSAERFDAAFPPIAPPKMVPEEWLTLINTEGHRVGDLYDRTAPLTASSGYRIARVRVVEVDDE